MTIAEFDHLPVEKKKELLLQCCGSSEWVSKMVSALPVEDLVDLLEVAEEKWNECGESAWREAFTHHPAIGDVNSLQRSENTRALAAAEQAGVQTAGAGTQEELAEFNRAYREKFGFIYIVCAAGRSGESLLGDLRSRINNGPAEELHNAAAEQLKITKLRLEKLFDINESSKYYEL